MDSFLTNDSHNKRPIIFSITGESVTFYQINLFKLRWKLDFGNWDTVLYKFVKVVQKEAPMNSLISEIPTHFVQALYFLLDIIITYYYLIS